ncbi:MAG: chloride channel protein [Desulfobulbaceae bacterium]|nr:chloride channel protein [Desulfobulbaceae bacterium]
MKSRNRSFREILVPLLLAVTIGALAGLGAVFFRWLISWGMDLLWPAGENFIDRLDNASWFMRLLIPTAVGLIIGPIITFWAQEVRGPGVPEVMEALALHGGRIRHRVTLIKTFVTATLISAGASVGREGPIVQIGASIGSSLAQLLKIGRNHHRMAVACGAAAGIAATFQAPMAGTMFVAEILLFEIETTYLSHIVIAAVTGTLVSKACWHETAVFQIPPFALGHPAELLIYFGLGIASGLVALLLMGAIFGLPRFFERCRIPLWLTPALGGLGVGLVGLLRPEALGIGYESINNALTGNITLTLAALLVFAKLLTTGLSIGSGMSGGIFAPSLFFGAMIGAVFGQGAEFLWPGADLSTAHYALVGMGAMVSATTLAPITAILTIFELTYNYEVILPLMVACIPSLMIVQILHGYSVYETKLLMKGINIVRGHDVNLLREMQISQHMDREFQTIREDTSLHEVVELMEKSTFPHFVVVDSNDFLVGVVTLRDLRDYFAHPEKYDCQTPIALLMQKEVITVRANHNMESAFQIFAEKSISFLPVVRPGSTRRVLGLLKKADLISAYNEHILKERIMPPLNWVCSMPPKEAKVQRNKGTEGQRKKQ